MAIEFTFVPNPVTDGGEVRAEFSDRDHAAALQAKRAGFENVVLQGLAGIVRESSLPEAPARLVAPHRATGSPLAAARRLRDLWARSNGRMALQISGGEDAEGHVQSLQRIDEYLTLLKRLWSSERPFDHEGPFYSLRGGFVPGALEAAGFLPVRMSGLSGTALKVAARHADVLELPAANLHDARFLMERVRAAAAQHGRSNKIRFALPIAIGEHETSNGRLPISPSVQSALELLAYAEAGVSEFTVTAASDRDLQLFGATVATLVRNSAARREPAQPVFAGTIAWNRAFSWQ